VLKPALLLLWRFGMWARGKEE